MYLDVCVRMHWLQRRTGWPEFQREAHLPSEDEWGEAGAVPDAGVLTREAGEDKEEEEDEGGEALPPLVPNKPQACGKP